MRRSLLIWVGLVGVSGGRAAWAEACQPRYSEELSQGRAYVTRREPAVRVELGSVETTPADAVVRIREVLYPRREELRVCVVAGSVLKPPEELSARLLLVLSNQLLTSARVAAGDARVDTRCIERVLRGLVFRGASAPIVQARAELKFVTYCKTTVETLPAYWEKKSEGAGMGSGGGGVGDGTIGLGNLGTLPVKKPGGK